MLQTIGRRLAATLLPQTTQVAIARSEGPSQQKRDPWAPQTLAHVSLKRTLTFDLLSLGPRLAIVNDARPHSGGIPRAAALGPSAAATGAVPLPGIYQLTGGYPYVVSQTCIFSGGVLLGAATCLGIGCVSYFPSLAQRLLKPEECRLQAQARTFFETLDAIEGVMEGNARLFAAPVDATNWGLRRLNAAVHGVPSSS